MKKLITFPLALLLLVSIHSNSFAQVVQSWISNYNYPSTNSGEKMVFTNEYQRNIAKYGSYVYIGGTTMTVNTSGSEDILVIKYAGNSSVPVWTYTYNTGTNFLDYLIDIKTDASGNVYALGYIKYVPGGSGSDLVVIKLNSSGVLQWTATYSEPSADVSPTALVVDNSGNVIVTGFFVNVTAFGLTVKFNSSGVFQWSRTYSAASTEEQRFHDITLDQYGDIYVGGFSKLTSGTSKYRRNLLVKYNAAGTLQWGVNGVWHDYWQSSGIIKIAYDFTFNKILGIATLNNHLIVVNHGSNGTLNWSTGTNNTTASDLILDGNGNVFVTGTVYNAGTAGYDFTTKKYNSAGTLLWSNSYNSGTNLYDFANAIDLDNCGDVYVTGRIQSPLASTNYDYYTARYSGATGTKIWDKKILINNWSEGGRDLAVTGPDNLFVTGSFRTSSTNSDFKTIKYSSSTNESCDGSGGASSLMNGVHSDLDLKNENLVSIYPNPSSQIITIDVPTSESYELEITDAFGKLITKEFVNSSSKSFDFTNFSRGIYFVKVVTNSTKSIQKVLIQ